MIDKLRCPQCNGSKIVLGAGYIEHKCDACNGLGFVDEAKATNVLPDDKSSTIAITEPLVKEVKALEVTTSKLDKRSKAYRDSIGRK
jgi:phage FluMu protein Com